MKWIKETGLMAVVVSMLGLNAGQAAAQPPYTPTLSVTVTGNSATIQWTPVNEAQGYTIQAGYAPGATALSTNVPASITGGVLNGIPAGVYYLRVRAYAGPYSGPWSNEVQAVVGAVGCTALDAPTAGFEVSGPMVKIGWSAVAGAAGYLVQYSRYPGITELQQTVLNGTAHQLYVPMLGTFYARVVAGNACSQLGPPSNEVEFTITDLSGGGGMRMPDPAPGQLLDMPPYGHAVALQVAQTYPGDLANACRNHNYLYKLVRELRKYDTRWGLNWKRGWTGSLSTDIVTYNPTALPDNEAKQIYVVDVVSAVELCLPNGFAWDWEGPTDRTWDAGQSGNPACGNEWCAKWTLDPYLAAGYPPFPIP